MMRRIAHLALVLIMPTLGSGCAATDRPPNRSVKVEIVARPGAEPPAIHLTLEIRR